MMKFKLLFKKGQTKLSENHHPQSGSEVQLPSASSASGGHFENEISKQNKNKTHQTSVKKVLNNFNSQKDENLVKSLKQNQKNTIERVIDSQKSDICSELSDNKTVLNNNGEINLKNSVNNSNLNVCKSFDNTCTTNELEFNLINNNQCVSENCDSLGKQPDNLVNKKDKIKNTTKNKLNINKNPIDNTDRSDVCLINKDCIVIKGKSKLNSNPKLTSTNNPRSTCKIESVKLDAGIDSSSSHALLTPVEGEDTKIMEFKELKQQLDNVSHEKQMLETKISDLLNYQETLRDELFKIKEVHDTDRHILSRSPLSDTATRDHNIHLGVDTGSTTRHAASAPASIAPTLGTSSEHLLDAPDWDKHSSSSLSEISLACLQDRITQMEETHYCTNEELQATLQELTDLQNQLFDLQHANDTLGHEKGVLLESLCRQTEKLEDTRTRAETLQELLLNGNNSRVSTSERENKLVQLLKSAQEEKDNLLVKQEEMSLELSELRRISNAMKSDSDRLAERVRLLESTIDATHAEKNDLDLQLTQLKEEANSRLIEIQRVSTLLENARAKIEELEEDRDKLRNKSELDELLNNARKEKDSLESQVAVLQDQISRSECKVAQQQDTILHLQEELKVARNNAKCSLSDLEYERDISKKEILRLTHDLELLQENFNELQVQIQCHLEDKRQLKSLLSENQKHLSETQNTLSVTKKSLEEEKAIREEQTEEWATFQKDLLMTVRVANDFKTEAQVKHENLVIENKQLKDRIRSLITQLDKLKNEENDKPLPSPVTRTTDTKSSVFSTVINREINRHNFNRQDSRLSVKSLIDSIENATKQAKTGPSSSLNSSTSSLSSVSGVSPLSPLSPIEDSFRNQQNNNNNIICNKKSNMSMLSSTPDIVHETLKPPNIKCNEETTTSTTAAIFESMVRRNSQTDLSERKDPLQALVKNGGSKRNALLKWCQSKTLGYHNIDITNFSSSWNDGLALCALLHSYLPDKVPYDTLTPNEKRRNFTIAFTAAESVGITTTLNTHDMITQERPDWNQVMAYVTSIYKHFET